MIVSSRRKRIGIVIGALFVGGLGWVIWPFIAGPRQMQDFCRSLAVGTSVAQVRAQAAQHGYRLSSPVEGRAFVYDPRSFGRFTCDLRFGPEGLSSSVYKFSD